MAGRVKIKDRDRGYKAAVRQIRVASASKVSLSVGVIGDEANKTYEAPECGESKGNRPPPKNAPTITMAELAEIHEFGLGVPQRSFIGDWIDETIDKKREQVRKMMRAVAKGRLESVEQGFAQLGNRYVAEVQKRMADGIPPGLAEETIARKGSDVPLIDTGQMRSSVTFRVDMK